MHAWAAFLIGVLVVIGAFLLFGALSNTAYYGLAIQIELTLAATLFIIAVILAYIFYVGLEAQHKRVKTGEEALIGAKGLATSDIKPKGEVRINGEFWQATAKDTEILSGQRVEVVSLDGMFLVVKPVEEKA
jgi:membrane-bound ClpP family serine protease